MMRKYNRKQEKAYEIALSSIHGLVAPFPNDSDSEVKASIQQKLFQFLDSFTDHQYELLQSNGKCTQMGFTDCLWMDVKTKELYPSCVHQSRYEFKYGDFSVVVSWWHGKYWTNFLNCIFGRYIHVSEYSFLMKHTDGTSVGKMDPTDIENVLVDLKKRLFDDLTEIVAEHTSKFEELIGKLTEKSNAKL